MDITDHTNTIPNGDRTTSITRAAELQRSSVAKELKKLDLVQPIPDPLAKDPSAEAPTTITTTTTNSSALEQKNHHHRQQQQQDVSTEQIVRFWNHPSLEHVSPAEKEDYLRTRQGITKQQLYQAWDKILLTSTNNSSGNDDDQMRNATKYRQNMDTVFDNRGVSPSYSHEQQQHQQQQQPTGYHNSSSYPSHDMSMPNKSQRRHPFMHTPVTTNIRDPIMSSQQTPPPPPSPSAQQQQQQQQQEQPYFYNDEEEDQLLGMGVQQVALVATIGGMLGLGAAAAVRWLNGGDFVLFPSPSSSTFGGAAGGAATVNTEQQHNKGRILQLQSPTNNPDNISPVGIEDTVTEDDNEEEGQEDDGDKEEEHDMTGGEYSEFTSQYVASSNVATSPSKDTSNSNVLVQAMAQLALLSETMQQHVSVQQRILQKLSTNTSSSTAQSVTDQSMLALRQQQESGASSTTNNKEPVHSIPCMMLWYKLVEVQVELASLKQSYSDSNRKTESSTELERRLEVTLERLAAVLKDLDLLNMPASAVTVTEKKNMDEVVDLISVADDVPPLTKTGEQEEESLLKKKENDVFASGATLETKEEDDIMSKDLPISDEKPNIDVVDNIDEVDDSARHLRDLRKAVIDLVRLNANDPVALKAGAQVLFLYVSNLSKNPHLPRFRRVFTSNDSFQKVDKLKGGRELLCAIGFVPSEDDRFLEWPPVQIESDGATPKSLTAQQKEALVQSYHLTETATALDFLKKMPIKEGEANTQEASLTLLEKALEALPDASLVPSTSTEQISNSSQESKTQNIGTDLGRTVNDST